MVQNLSCARRRESGGKAPVGSGGGGVIIRVQPGASLVGLILHSVTGPLYDNGLGVLQQSVQDGQRHGAVIEDGCPILKGLVGDQNERFKIT